MHCYIRRSYNLIALSFACLLLWQPVQAGYNPEQDLDELRMSEVTAGRLLLPSSTPGRYRPLPTLHTDVHMRVSGAVASVTIRQRFYNPGDDWVEGIYVFPLPEQAAVHRMRMHVGERVIEGLVKEKQEAKRTYQNAKAAGKRASLVEQERPNIFTTSVANIGPKEEILVEMEYVESVRYIDHRFRLRFPTVVGPRFIPGQPIKENSHPSGSGWAFDSDVVPDASHITPPVLPPGRGKINPLTMTVELDAGMPLHKLISSYQRMQFKQRDDGVYVGKFDEREFADRDFELVWIPELGHAPRAAVFIEQRNNDHYALLLAMPPKTESSQVSAFPRELILVIDTSGSMAGRSIKQAVPAAHYALDQLNTGDRFNVIQFNTHTESLFIHPKAVDPLTLSEAHRYLDRLRATGGTQMLPALQQALAEAPSQTSEDEKTQSKLLRQIVFITDGAVGNEKQLFNFIRAGLGNSRLFTVGIGSAPNSYFMRRAAEFGRGTFTYIGKPEEVHDKMATLFNKIRYPVLMDIRIEWSENESLETWPQQFPDLYLGEPVVVSAKLNHEGGNAILRGMLGTRPWQFELSLRNAVGRGGISTLWARNKIKGLMDQQLGEQSSPQIRKQVVDLGIDFNLVSKYTSLVAVDMTPARPRSESLHSKAMPTNLPHGWSYPHVFGQLPRTASAAPWHTLVGVLLLLLAAGFLIWWWYTRASYSWRAV